MTHVEYLSHYYVPKYLLAQPQKCKEIGLVAHIEFEFKYFPLFSSVNNLDAYLYKYKRLTRVQFQFHITPPLLLKSSITSNSGRKFMIRAGVWKSHKQKFLEVCAERYD